MSAGEDVAATAEKARRAVDTATWVAIGLGLAFTAVNVQTFAAAGAPAWSPGWSVAWLLDPMVSVLLLAVVRAEQVTARWQVAMPWQVAATKWAAFAATYVMNTWSAWRDGLPSAVVLHSVPPVFVLLAAESAPALRDRLTEAVARADAARDDLSLRQVGFEGATRSSPTPVLQPPRSDPAPTTDASSMEPAQERPAVKTPSRRVLSLAGRVAVGEELTGSMVAAEHGCSERNARRLLAEARQLAMEQASEAPEPDGERRVELLVVGGSW